MHDLRTATKEYDNSKREIQRKNVGVQRSDIAANSFEIESANKTSAIDGPV